MRRRLLGSKVTRTVPATRLEAMYAQSSDPWSLASSANDYERDKYADTVLQLPQLRYARALEVGCSVGVLSAELAPRCDALLGIDLSEIALAEARVRNRGNPQVSFARHLMPDEPPAGLFDLLVFSEVLYFFERRDLRRVADWAATATAPGADLLLVNYLGPLAEYPLTGNRAATLFMTAAKTWAEPIGCQRRTQYRIDVLHRRN